MRIAEILPINNDNSDKVVSVLSSYLANTQFKDYSSWSEAIKLIRAFREYELTGSVEKFAKILGVAV